ncbi:MAG: hypothetical protein DID91_2727702838 [Candidatus Nitrotoga sp. MKT]|nr:MAG: hypothetical protein DID91_2727702838 [Candidatus Nitrotoga sp. MKT]
MLGKAVEGRIDFECVRRMWFLTGLSKITIPIVVINTTSAADDANKLAQGYMVTDIVVIQLGIRSIPRSDGK